MKIRIAVVLLVLASGTVGCKTHVPARFNAGEGLDDKKALLVPFSELNRNRWHTESRRGNLLTAYTEKWIRQNADHDLIQYAGVINQIRDWPSNRITRTNWRTILADSDLEYVVIGDLIESRLQSEKVINIRDASATVNYRVIEAESGKTIYKRDRLTVTLGDQREEIDAPISVMGSNEEAVELQLLATMGRAIGRELFGYTKD